MDPKRYITEVKEITENGEAVIILPDELINELGWKEGDVLDFEVVNDAIIIRNLTKENNERRDDYTPSNG
jgi:bifunctional DNA-binding transcriptional regulator/antitoxin component of YhaV-PrlF toxin-antitoxin module